MAIDTAQELVRKTGNLSVPLHIRHAPTKLMKEIGYGKNYKYARAFEGNFAAQDFLPKEIKDELIYHPQKNPAEMKILERLLLWWGLRFGFYHVSTDCILFAAVVSGLSSLLFRH